MREMHYLLVLVVLLLASGCATVTKPEHLMYRSGAVVETLSGNVALSFAADGRSISGNGSLLYRRPDQLRVTILTPFGSVFQDVYVAGEQVTIVSPGEGVAFRGNVQDLPATGNMSGWRYLRWLIDIDTPDTARKNGMIQRVNRFGENEQVVFERGVLRSKTLAGGDCGKYDRYVTVNDVALPLEITYDTATGEHFKIVLDEPEVNSTLPSDSFTPRLDDLKLYPLTVLR